MERHLFAVEACNHAGDLARIAGHRVEAKDAETVQVDRRERGLEVREEESDLPAFFRGVAVVAVDHEVLEPGHPRRRGHDAQRDGELGEIDLAADDARNRERTRSG